MRNRENFALCMIITVVSFLGFAVENIWLAATKGYINNRNMYLPFLLGYGLAIAAIYLLFGTPSKFAFLGKKVNGGSSFSKMFLYFLAVMVCVSVGEIVLGTVVEKTCNVIWWDYTDLPLNITRYTTLPTSVAFSALITIFMQHFFEPLKDWFMKWNFQRLRFVSTVCIIVLIADFLCSAARVYKNQEMVPVWKIATEAAGQ